MSKVTDVRVVDRADDTDIAATAREGLLAMSVAVRLQLMAELMDDEITAAVGPKHAKLADRTAVRHGATTGRWCWAAER